MSHFCWLPTIVARWGGPPLRPLGVPPLLLDRPRSKTSTTNELHGSRAFIETFGKETVVMPGKAAIRYMKPLLRTSAPSS